MNDLDTKKSKPVDYLHGFKNMTKKQLEDNLWGQGQPTF